MAKWIRASERVPTVEEYERGGGYVIAAFEDGTVRHSYKRPYDKGWTHDSPKNEVTHWMPFPDPPKEDEDG